MSNLLVDDADGVRLITLNRPEKLNAFDNALYHAAADALDEALGRDDIKCVVFTGAGRAFSAGQDLAEMATIDAGAAASGGLPHGFPRFLDTAATYEKPLLAAVNGLGIGIGMTLLLHCDLALVADTARLRAPFVPLGVVPEAAGSLLMPQIMGNQRASLALYTGDWVSAEEAVAANLALRVVPAERVVEETLEIARRIATQPVNVLVETKKVVVAGRIDAVRAARRREDEAFARMVGAAANAEALGAFLGERSAP
ncbi:MAG: enoyl-CoA hydratase/isomerase family protein [Acidimicrobiia bacterium]